MTVTLSDINGFINQINTTSSGELQAYSKVEYLSKMEQLNQYKTLLESCIQVSQCSARTKDIKIDVLLAGVKKRVKADRMNAGTILASVASRIDNLSMAIASTPAQIEAAQTTLTRVKGAIKRLPGMTGRGWFSLKGIFCSMPTPSLRQVALATIGVATLTAAAYTTMMAKGGAAMGGAAFNGTTP